MSKFKLKLTGISDDTGKPQTLEMEAYAKDAEELAARLDKEFNLKLDDKGWSMYIEWLSDDESKLHMEHLDEWDTWTADGMIMADMPRFDDALGRWVPISAYDKALYDYLCGTEWNEDEKDRLVLQRLKPGWA